MYPDTKVRGANMRPTWWGRQDQGGPHVGTMNFAIWVATVGHGSLQIQKVHIEVDIKLLHHCVLQSTHFMTFELII